jgi:ABC-type amino acid transport system permease subunit
MGENWMGIWIGTFIGAFIIVVAIYDYFDKKKRGQEIKIWKYLLAIIVGLALLFPIVSGIVLWLLGLPL